MYQASLEKKIEPTGPDSENFAFLEAIFQKLHKTFTWWVRELDTYNIINLIAFTIALMLHRNKCIFWRIPGSGQYHTFCLCMFFF